MDALDQFRWAYRVETPGGKGSVEGSIWASGAAAAMEQVDRIRREVAGHLGLSPEDLGWSVEWGTMPVDVRTN